MDKELKSKILDLLDEHPNGLTSYQMREYIKGYTYQSMYLACKSLYLHSRSVCCRGVVTYYSYGALRKKPDLILFFAK